MCDEAEFRAAVAAPLTQRPRVVMTRAEFLALGEYSCSLPTGTWLVGEYYDCGSATEIGIVWMDLVLSDG